MIRRWLLPLLIIALLAAVLANRTELRTLGRALSIGRWQWVALATLVQVGAYLAYAELYRSAFAAAGIARRLGDTVPVVLGSLFVNLVVPSAGLAGAALFMDDAARRGFAPARAAAGVVLVTATDFTVLACLLLSSLAQTLQGGDFPGLMALGPAGMAAIVGAIAGTLLLGLWRPGWVRGPLEAVRSGAAAVARRLRRPEPLPPEWAERTTRDIAAASEAVRTRPIRLARLFAVDLVMHALNVVTLGAMFLAFGQRLPIGPLVAGYALGMAAWILSPVPQGIGVVEAVLALVYASFGVPAPAAAAIAVTFRGLTLWLPLAIGFLVVRRLESFRSEPRGGRADER